MKIDKQNSGNLNISLEDHQQFSHNIITQHFKKMQCDNV